MHKPATSHDTKLCNIALVHWWALATICLIQLVSNCV